MSDNSEYNLGTEKKRTFIISFIYYLLLIAIAVVLVKYVLPMLMPFVLGLGIAYILRKPTRYITKKLNTGYKKTQKLSASKRYRQFSIKKFLFEMKIYRGGFRYGLHI